MPASRADPTNAAALKRVGITPTRKKLWFNDPRAFAHDVCNVQGDRWQEKFWAALGGPHLDPFAKARLALKACKGPGKTFGLAIAGWWWLMTRPHANGIVCSITADNLRDNLWTEFARVQNRSPVLQHFFTIKGERIESKEHPRSWWLSARSFPQNPDKNQQANTLAGLHGRFPLVLLDEVGDYPDGVVVAAEAIFSDKYADPRLVVAGNPTNTDGPLYRICERDRRDWWVYEITGDPDDPDCASRINKEENRRLIERWGKDHAYTLVNVYGRFPPKGANKLLGPDIVMQASTRQPDIRVYRQYPTIMALDPARGGECEAVLYRRQGPAVHTARTWREPDTMVLCDQIVLEVNANRPKRFLMDKGGLGAPIYDRLRQLGVEVVGLDMGAAAAEDDKFFDKRTELWWRMAESIKAGACIPNDAKLRADLTGPNIEWKTTNKKTKIRLEPKDSMQKRGMSSPDHGDALSMTYDPSVESMAYDADDPLGALSAALGMHRQNNRIIGGTDERDNWDPLEGY